MIDELVNSADGLLVLIFIIVIVVFFLFWAHKVYESFFWALLGLGLYLFIHEITFVFPEITKTVFFWWWIVDNRGMLLWIAKILAILLFFFTPMTMWLNVYGVVRNTFWFFCKTLVLSVFFVCFWVVLISLLSADTGLFWEAPIFNKSLSEYVYFQNSFLFAWLTSKVEFIILWSFLLILYKILFSHWITSIFVMTSILYAKSNAVFAKRNLDSVIHPDTHMADDDNSDEHH